MRIGGENGLRQAPVAKGEVTARAGGATGAAEDGPSPFARVLRGLGREVDHGE